MRLVAFANGSLLTFTSGTLADAEAPPTLTISAASSDARPRMPMLRSFPNLACALGFGTSQARALDAAMLAPATRHYKAPGTSYRMRGRLMR